MNLNPCIAVVSCSGLKTAESIIELLSEHTNINKTIKDESTTYLWNIKTKYYTAQVDLCPVRTGETRSEAFNKRVEAIIVYFDSNKDSGLDDVKMWEGLLEDSQPDVKLLITDVCTADTKINNSDAVKWCVKHGFELIELKSDNVKANACESDEENDMDNEVHGIERIIEALQNHLWTNLVMNSKESQASTVKESNPSSSIDSMITNMFNDEEADFAELFQHLHMMRESVQSLSVRERRQCAEQVVSAFWRAIGGDEEEMGDI